MTESEMTRKLCRALEGLGAVTYVAVGGRMSRPGWPDRWIGHRDWQGWVEFKAAGAKPRANQLACRRDIERALGQGSAAIAWHPGDGVIGRVETGACWCEWDGTARDLLRAMRELKAFVVDSGASLKQGGHN